MNPMAMPLTAYSGFSVLQPRKKPSTDPVAPVLSATMRKRLKDDPRYDSIQALEQGAMNHIDNSGWAGVAAQLANAWVGKDEEKKLEGDYLNQQNQRQATIDHLMGNDPNMDPTVRELAKDPEYGDFAVSAYLKNKFDPKERPKYNTTNVNNRITAYREDDPTQTKDMGAAPESAPTGKVAEYKMYKDDALARGVTPLPPADYFAEQSRAGRAPGQPRQPTVAEQKYQYLIDQGVDPSRAKGLAYGGIQVSTDSNGMPVETNLAGNGPPKGPGSGQGITPPKLAQQRGAENDSLDASISQIDDMLASPEWQSGVGVRSAAKQAWNRLAAPIVGGYQEDAGKMQIDVASLRQNAIAAIRARGGDERTTEAAIKRVNELLPSTGFFTSTEEVRAKMAQVRDWLATQRERPMAVDPRSGDNRKPSMPGVNADPLGILK